jgi:hypothetical protein
MIDHQTGPEAGAVGAVASTIVVRDNRTNRPSGTLTVTVRLSGQVTEVYSNPGMVTISGPLVTRAYEIGGEGRLCGGEGRRRRGCGHSTVVSGEVTLR